MKDFITYVLVGIGAAVAVIFAYNSLTGRMEIPIVGADGKIEGDYAIEAIMRLGRPYVCNFEKSDEISRILGTVHTDSQKIYGEFKISTSIVKDEFNSFLIVKDGEAFAWTSLQNIGYRAKAVRSASKGASPAEQAQILGTRDLLPYRCEPWQNVDSSMFETPSWINFIEPKV